MMLSRILSNMLITVTNAIMTYACNVGLDIITLSIIIDLSLPRRKSCTPVQEAVGFVMLAIEASTSFLVQLVTIANHVAV